MRHRPLRMHDWKSGDSKLLSKLLLLNILGVAMFPRVINITLLVRFSVQLWP